MRPKTAVYKAGSRRGRDHHRAAVGDDVAVGCVGVDDTEIHGPGDRRGVLSGNSRSNRGGRDALCEGHGVLTKLDR